jgi:hypothetical protein
MDPNATWSTATNEALSPDERMTAIDALLTWVDRGGFLPAGVSTADIEAEAEKVGAEMLSS